MTLTNSTVADNTAYGNGGGIHSNGTMLTLTNSTVSGNTASATDAFSSLGNGGGIYNGGVMLTLTNSTIADNKTDGNGGGIDDNGETTILTFCTFFGNQAIDGGGLSTSSQMALQNSLIAGNSASQNPDLAGQVTSKGYNLIQDATGAQLQSTDLVDIPLSAIKIDPTLQLNSGITRTHALLPGSQAIDIIPLSSCQIKVDGVLIKTDQRGIKRPQGTACDIGAYEYVPEKV